MTFLQKEARMIRKNTGPAALFLCLALCMTSACHSASDLPEEPVEPAAYIETEPAPTVAASKIRPGMNYAVKTEADTEEISKTEETTTEPETPSPKIGLTALAMVPNYVNVRSGPSVDDEIVGKIYNYCAAEIQDEVVCEDGNWYLMTSGNCTGYIKSEYFLVGEEAEAMRKEVGVLMGTVTEDYLRVRSEPNLNDPDNVFTFYERGTEVYITELTEDGWAKIESDAASTGYVYAECLDLKTVFKTAITLEEEEEAIRIQQEREEAARKAEEEYQAALKAQQEAEAAAAAAAAEQAAKQQAQQEQQTQPAIPADPGAASTGDAAADALRNAVVQYALQYVGKPYVHGGRSLETGTDCSGFTSLVYQHFGYYPSYTPAGQADQYPHVDLSQLKPGDLLFYSNSQKYLGHVALYIGNGQIVHSGTEATGVLISSAYYRDPLFAARVIP